jgi:cobalt/nickel transport system permease protein
MGVSGFLAGILSRYVLRRISSPVIAGFIAGAGGVAGAAILTAMALWGSGEFFLPTAKLILVAHVPIIIIEGIICSFVCSFIYRTMPGFLEE